MIDVKNAGYRVGNKWLVKEVTQQFEPGKLHVICGQNGAGKTTLLKLIGGEVTPVTGSINYDGVAIASQKRGALAQRRAMLSQEIDIVFPMPVEEIIMMGRYPHFTAQPSAADQQIVDELLSLLDLSKLARRNYNTLSGGEKQRVQFARVLAQVWSPLSNGSRILLLDEPIAALDLKYQLLLLKVVRRFLDAQTIIVAILHDLNMALNFCDRAVLMKEGAVFAAGKPREVFTTENIRSAFDVTTSLISNGDTNIIWPVAE